MVRTSKNPNYLHCYEVTHTDFQSKTHLMCQYSRSAHYCEMTFRRSWSPVLPSGWMEQQRDGSCIAGLSRSVSRCAGSVQGSNMSLRLSHSHNTVTHKPRKLTSGQHRRVEKQEGVRGRNKTAWKHVSGLLSRSSKILHYCVAETRGP